MSITTEAATGHGAAMRSGVAAAWDQIAANADQAELDRCVPVENIDLLRDAGLFKALQPSR